MSSLDSAVPPVIVIACSLPVAMSLADTLTMPLASMSKATSICGIPLARKREPGEHELAEGAPGDEAVSASPCRTWISTLVWLSSAVVKISDLRMGCCCARSGG